MSKKKKRPGQRPKKKRKEDAVENNGNGLWLAVRHAASIGWVQNLGGGFLLTSIALVAAIMTSTQVRTAAITFGLVGTVLIWVIVYFVWRDTPTMNVKTDDIRFKVRSTILPADPNFAVFFVRYGSSLGDTISPMPIALAVTITNVSQVPVTLDDISVEVRESDSGWTRLKKWIKLQHIPTVGQRMYWVYGDLRNAALLDFAANGVDQLLEGKQLNPNLPLQGWLFFERPDSFLGDDGATIQWRFKAKDTAGNEYEATSESESIKKKPEPAIDVQPNSPFLKFTGEKDDLSGLASRRWSEPIP